MIGIASNDAGGAELLSEYVVRNKNKYIFFLTGPAKKIFKKKIKNLKISNFKNSLNKLDKVISSTGWATKNEINIIRECKKKEIKVCAYLDHWVNYKQRFIVDNKLILPDEIWVSDSLAFKIAKKEFKKKIKIKKIKNYFFEKAKNFFNKKNKLINSNKKKVLYLCEPIDDHKKKNFYTEKKCISLFFDTLGKFKKIKNITFRPHPYESNKKYNWVKNSKKYNIKICKKNNIFSEISKNDIVVGCNTVALYLAILAKKRVYTSVPKGYFCSIPSKKITYLNQL